MSEDGYIDYIAPQIYWSDNYIMEGKKTKLFKERLALWRSLNTNDTPMYIGLAAYKAGNSLKEDPGWKKSSNNLKKQLNQIRNGNSEGYRSVPGFGREGDQEDDSGHRHDADQQ